MRKQSGRILLAATISMFAWSCNQSDPAPKGDYVSGVFVINEGNFLQNNGGISYFSREKTTAESDLFSLVNKTPIQGGAQGYIVTGETGLILVDNDKAGLDKVQIVNSNTFTTVATIGAPDIENPRKVVASSSTKAYVSCWGTNSDYTYKTGYIAVIDLTTNKVTKKINIANGPDNLFYNNGKLVVGTTTFGSGKTLTVINTATDEVAKTVTFSGVPVPVGIDANGKLWVSSGIDMVKLNVETYAVESTLKIGSDASKSAGPFALSADLKTVYFVLSYFDALYKQHGATYKFAITDAQINVTTPFLQRIFTGLAVDPSQGLLYAGATPSLGQAGYAVRYRPDGSVVDSVKVGISPTGFFFR